jgi:hypothetical protein
LTSLGLALTACASSGTPTGPIVYSQAEAADSVRILVGQTIVVGSIRIRFSAVESDSRCPSDVVCVWAGDAVAALIAEQNCDCRSPSYDLKLHTTLEPKSGTVYGYRIELLRITPYPNSMTPIKQDAYAAWLRVVPVEG